jgi:delta 1-pyrroline-5-carboxylate dehydrogenase
MEQPHEAYPVVGGKPVEGREEPSRNPASTEQVVGVCKLASPDDVERKTGWVWPALQRLRVLSSAF